MNGNIVRGPQFISSEVYISSAETSEVRWMGETSTHFLATGETTSGQFCLVEETAKRGEAVPLHRHEEDVESFYVLEGRSPFILMASLDSAAAQVPSCMCLLVQSMGSGSRLTALATLS